MNEAANPSVMDNARKVGDEVLDLGRKAYLFGLGTLAAAEEEARGVFDRMVTRGETFEKSERNKLAQATEKAKDLGQQVEQKFQQAVSNTLHRAGVPSSEEIRTLIERVEELTDKVDKLAADK